MLCLLSFGNNGKLDSDDEDILIIVVVFVVCEGYQKIKYNVIRIILL